MKKIRFWKMSGSGNDFLVIDRRNQSLIADPSRFARQACRAKVSVGADGVLFLEESKKAEFAMRIFNADGSEAEMCGNGARCIARFAFLQGIAREVMSFETRAGMVEAEVKGRRVKIRMNEPKDLRLHQKIWVEGKEVVLHGVNSGVPHAALFVEDLEKVEVKELGRKIRFHQAFQPAGTNVNFLRVADPHHLWIRTYERGVEDETLACGTGAVASAVIAAALDLAESPVFLRTRGGEEITVYFDRRGLQFCNLFLEGNTTVAYEGDLWEEALL
ncbi:MAG: diaminopimelate epimerase [candidate division NC10 bacterium]|nr:diaminopimelate epimerase [candidate division NC10 bacterium]